MPGKLLTIVIVVILAIAAVIGYVAVGGKLGGGPSTTGGIRFFLKDLPGNFTHVYVVIRSIELHLSEKNGTQNMTDVPEEVELEHANLTVDLAALQNLTKLVGHANLPAGYYTLIDLDISLAWGTLPDGTVVSFTVVSGDVRVNHPFYLLPGGTASIVLDINLARSIVPTGNGNYNFTPVVGSTTITE